MRLLNPDKIEIDKSGADFTVGTMTDRDDTYGHLYESALVGWFNGVDTLLDYLEEHMPKPKRDGDSDNRGTNDFNHFKSYAETMDVFKNRPDEVLDFEPIDDSELKTWDEMGNDIEYNVTGDFVDIGRYMHGVPEVFGSMHNGNPRRYRADIKLNLHWSGGVDKEVINERLKHTVALVDWLEMNNVRTAITAISSNSNAHVEVMVKDYHHHLDLRQLAIASHSEFLRRIMFRWREYSDTWTYHYGSSLDLHETYKPGEPDSNFEMPIFIDSYSSDSEGYSERFKLLREKIAKLIDEGQLEPQTILNHG